MSEYNGGNALIVTHVRVIDVKTKLVTTLTSSSLSSAIIAAREFSRETSCLKTLAFAANPGTDEIVVIGTSRYNLVPDHEIDFRGCSNGVPTIDSYDSAISATAVNGATCSASGMVFDGVDDYVDVTPWPFGGALTLEVYLKFDSFDNTDAAVFDFSDANEEYENNTICLREEDSPDDGYGSFRTRNAKVAPPSWSRKGLNSGRERSGYTLWRLSMRPAPCNFLRTVPSTILSRVGPYPTLFSESFTGSERCSLRTRRTVSFRAPSRTFASGAMWRLTKGKLASCFRSA